MEGQLFTLSSQEKQAYHPSGTHAGKYWAGYKAAGGGETVGKNLYCGFCGKNGQGTVSRLRVG